MGASIGSVIGGMIFDWQGPVFLFRVCALLAVSSTTLAGWTCASLYQSIPSPDSKRGMELEIEMGQQPSTHGLMSAREEAMEETVEEEMKE